MKKRVLSIILVVVMLLSLMPATVFATENEAKIGSDEYSTLEAAIDAVQNNETIVMLQDVIYGTSITINNGKTFTIDFKDGSTQHTFTWDVTSGSTINRDIFTIGGNSIVTVKNMNFLVGGPDEQGNRIFNVNSTGKLTLNNMTLNSGDSIRNTPVQNNGGTVVIDGGNITTDSTKSNLISPNAPNPVVQNLGGTTTFKGNGVYTMQNTGTGAAWLGKVITQPAQSTDDDRDSECGTVIIENGTFNTGQIVDVNGKGTITINDATYGTGNGPIIKAFHGGIKSNITINNITTSAMVFAQVIEELETRINFQNGNVKYTPTKFCINQNGTAAMTSVSIKNGKFGPKTGTTDIHDEINNLLASGAAIYALTGDPDGYTYKVETITIADILPNALLSDSNNKWNNENTYSIAYVYGGKLYFQEKDNPTSVINDLLITTPLTKSGDNYTVESGGRAFTFKMNLGVLESITVSGVESDRLSGKYISPKQSITPSVSLEDWAYGDTANDPSVDGNDGEGTVIYKYKAKNADDTTYTTDVPTKAGNYVVKAEIAETASYAAGSATTEFAISQKQLIVTGTEVVDSKTYDGTTSVSFKDNKKGTLSNLVEGDTVTLDATAAYDTPAVGTEKRITVVYTIDGADAGNYIKPVDSTFTGEITKATQTDISSTPYEGTYDGNPHKITVNPNGGTVTYSLEENGTYAETAPTFTNVTDGAIVYFKVTKDNYEDFKGSNKVTISPAAITDAAAPSQVYTGSVLTPVLTVTAGGLAVDTFTVGDWNAELINADTYTATVTGTGNFTGSKQVSFVITPKPLSNDALTITGTYTYTGDNIVPTFTVKDGDIVLDDETYSSSFENNKLAHSDSGEDAPKVSVILSGNYSGTLSKTFAIAKKPVTITAKDKSAYVGEAAPQLGDNDYTVTGLVGDDTLTTKPALAYESTPDMTKSGTVAIKASDADAGSNYVISYVDGTLTISNRPYSGGDSSSSTVTVPVSGNENSVKVQATVSGSTATVKQIKEADLAKVADGESVSIDLSSAGKNVDTVKIPTQTVEKIAEKSSMTVKLPVAAVEFDKAATEEIVDQAKGSNIELVVDDIKEVSLNAVQKEAVKKLDTAVIIDAYLVSNGTRLCTEDKGGFGRGKANVILPYEIKNNRSAANYSVYYVDDEGNRQKLDAKYDEELKAFVFEIQHFSVYAVAYDEYVMPFVDVPETAYYYDAVKWAAANAITSGTDATHFNPLGITTRGQMVTFLWNAAGKPEPASTTCKFTDIKEGSYYYKAVLWAYEEGITDGTSETTFEPDINVSRAQVVTFLWRYAGKPVVNYWMQMTDIASGQYYTEAVRWALSEKITDGTSKTTFSPNDDCLRGQIVTFLYRNFGK